MAHGTRTFFTWRCEWIARSGLSLSSSLREYSTCEIVIAIICAAMPSIAALIKTTKLRSIFTRKSSSGSYGHKDLQYSKRQRIPNGIHSVDRTGNDSYVELHNSEQNRLDIPLNAIGRLVEVDVEVQSQRTADKGLRSKIRSS